MDIRILIAEDDPILAMHQDGGRLEAVVVQNDVMHGVFSHRLRLPQHRGRTAEESVQADEEHCDQRHDDPSGGNTMRLLEMRSLVDVVVRGEFAHRALPCSKVRAEDARHSVAGACSLYERLPLW